MQKERKCYKLLMLLKILMDSPSIRRMENFQLTQTPIWSIQSFYHLDTVHRYPSHQPVSFCVPTHLLRVLFGTSSREMKKRSHKKLTRLHMTSLKI